MKKLKEPILPTPKPAGPIFPHPQRQAEKLVRQRTAPKGTKEMRVTLRDRLFVFRRLLRSMPWLSDSDSCRLAAMLNHYACACASGDIQERKRWMRQMLSVSGLAVTN